MTFKKMQEIEQIIGCMVYLLNTGEITPDMEPNVVNGVPGARFYSINYSGVTSMLFKLPVKSHMGKMVYQNIRFENEYNLQDIKNLFNIAVTRFIANNPTVTIGVSTENENTPLPVYGTPGAGASDVHSSVDIILAPGEKSLIKTDLKFDIPKGYEVDVRPRSGLANKNMITVLNTPGLVDEDYKGEVGVILINHGSESFRIHKGDRIAQLSIKRTIRANFVRVSNVGTSDRGTGGFGHTGI